MRTVMMFLIVALATVAWGETFRCPNGAIVSLGDTLAAVRVKCDPPTDIDRRYEPAGRFGTASVEAEVWTYDGGPYTFVYYLTFTNGTLTNIVSGDYGTRRK